MKPEQLKQVVFVVAFLLILVHNVMLVREKKLNEAEIADLKARLYLSAGSTTNQAAPPTPRPDQ